MHVALDRAHENRILQIVYADRGQGFVVDEASQESAGDAVRDLQGFVQGHGAEQGSVNGAAEADAFDGLAVAEFVEGFRAVLGDKVGVLDDASGRGPHPDVSVLAGGGEQGTVRAEGDVGDGLVVTTQDFQELAIGHLPDVDFRLAGGRLGFASFVGVILEVVDREDSEGGVWGASQGCDFSGGRESEVGDGVVTVEGPEVEARFDRVGGD